MNYLSDIELYYAPPENHTGEKIIIYNEDYKHIVKVMRHSEGDIIYITNGKGLICKSRLEKTGNNSVEFSPVEKIHFKNEFKNITFCIPKLKNQDRFEFALEKSVELGINNFIVYDSLRTVSKGEKKERWNKILIAAMKQSLLSYLPEIGYASLTDISAYPGEKIILEQKSGKYFKYFSYDHNKKYYFIFGPEGGLDKSELQMFNNADFYKLAVNRLRSETAIIKCASFLNDLVLYA